MNLPFLNRVSGRDKAFLTRQLSAMLGSGLPLNKAIGILASQTRNETLKTILAQVESDLETGLSFSAAIAKHPVLFDRVFVNVVVSGERVGRLAEVLGQLASQLEKDTSFRSRVLGAFIYPAFIFVTMIVVGAVMVVYIVPKLEPVFQESGAQLPLLTQGLVTFSGLLEHYWWLCILALIGAGALVTTYLRSKAGERFSSLIQIHLPVGMGYDIYMARMTRTLGMLVAAGTPIIEAITVTGAVMDNSYYNDLLIQSAEQVKRGVPLSVPLQKSSIIPPIVGQMIAVGEQTGRLDQILLNLADYYEDEADGKIKQMSSLIEPVIIVIIGIGVGILVYSILVPIYNIAQLQ